MRLGVGRLVSAMYRRRRRRRTEGCQQITWRQSRHTHHTRKQRDGEERRATTRPPRALPQSIAHCVHEAVRCGVYVRYLRVRCSGHTQTLGPPCRSFWHHAPVWRCAHGAQQGLQPAHHGERETRVSSRERESEKRASEERDRARKRQKCRASA